VVLGTSAHRSSAKGKSKSATATATGGKAAEESSFKKLRPRQWGAKAGVQKLGPDVVN
jgi:hypothetical protein